MESLLAGTNALTNKTEFCTGLVIFVICLGVDMIYNLLLREPGRLHIFDSCHYIQAGLYLTIAIQHACGATTLPPANLGQMLLLDGFGMPYCAALAALLSANKMTPLSLIFVQSSIIALTAVTTYTCALRMKLGLAWSATAGLLWSLYPAAIVSAGTFLSEPLSGLLVCLLALAAILCRQEQRPRDWCAFGFITGAIIVTKPALLINLALVLLILAISFSQQILPLLKPSRPLLKTLTTRTLALGSGTALALLPWLIVTAAFAGHAEIMPSRLPSTNMALGCDYEIGFWETMPVPPLTLHNYARNPIRVFYELATEHTLEMPTILAKKFARLYLGLFNDFHDSVFGLSFYWQRLLHGLLIVFSFAGIISTFVSKNSSKEEKFGIALVSANLLTHCAYMPFESLPRYAFSAMPLLFIAATSMLKKVAIARNRNSLIFVIAALALAFTCAQVQFDDVETKHYALRQGDTAKREITAIKSSDKPAWVALITDADLNNNNCKVKFNGQEIDLKATNLRDYPSGFPYQHTINDIEDLLSRIRGVNVDKLEHYSLIALPIEILRADQANTIEVTATAPLIIFGQKREVNEDFLLIPALRYFSVTKMFASESGLDGRPPDHRIVRAAKSTSAVKEKTLSPGEDLRLFLLVSPQANPTVDAQAGHAGSTLRLW